MSSNCKTVSCASAIFLALMAAGYSESAAAQQSPSSQSYPANQSAPPPAAQNPAQSGLPEIVPQSAPAQSQTQSSAQPAAPVIGPMIGLDVFSSDRQNVGKINDAVISADGKVQRVVISTGGFLGFGTKKVAVGWNQIRINEAQKNATTTLTADRLQNAPAFDPANVVHASATETMPNIAPAAGSPSPNNGSAGQNPTGQNPTGIPINGTGPAGSQ